MSASGNNFRSTLSGGKGTLGKGLPSYTPLTRADGLTLRRLSPTFDTVIRSSVFQHPQLCHSAAARILWTSRGRRRWLVPMAKITPVAQRVPDPDELRRLLKHWKVLLVTGIDIAVGSGYTHEHSKLLIDGPTKKNVLVVDPDDTRNDTLKSRALATHLGKGHLGLLTPEELAKYGAEHELAYLQDLDEFCRAWRAPRAPANGGFDGPGDVGLPAVQAVDGTNLQKFLEWIKRRSE